ncbi:MAG: nucleotidyl transferase AbiEii/AbiGii toxin family protein [Myxococcales bacterium]|nr:nucleotidyl transferase AbiEii/AbiGii toxin family protein [Myxococcales bacterium]
MEKALATLGAVLKSRGLRYELVIVGGGALMLLGVIARATRDIDVVALVQEGRYLGADPLPESLVRAVRDVGTVMGLDAGWINPGPTDLLRFGLPAGFETRLIDRHYDGLLLHLIGPHDQICLKFYAAADQGPRSKHLDDLRRLTPSRRELRQAASWARGHDPSPGFHSLTEQVLAAFESEENDGTA